MSDLRWYSLVLVGCMIFLGCAGAPVEPLSRHTQQPDLVFIQEIDPTIIQEIRYAGIHNFLGRPVKGYKAPKCLLTLEAAKALASVQAEMRAYSLSLKVYDCYRPQRAVDNFVVWAKDLTDVKMKREFYPQVEKTSLFKDGYIAEKSGHSRGSTVDLSIVPVPIPSQDNFTQGQPLRQCFLPLKKRFRDNSLDMGTGFDCFDPLAHTANPLIPEIQKRNRLLLKSIMEKFGFKNLPEEWWHYTLRDEPYPNRYFDIEIE